MDNSFDKEAWRRAHPMDYIKVMEILEQATHPIVQDGVFKEFYKITRLHIPDFLFKYYSITDDIGLNENKLDTLRRQKIYMPEIKTFNDPFDSKAYFYDPDRLENGPGGAFEMPTDVLRAAAFTECGINSLPMWAHYANNHRGYCVSYDTKDMDNSLMFSCTMPIQYSDKRIDITKYIGMACPKPMLFG